jgi:hypothetical protein
MKGESMESNIEHPSRENSRARLRVVGGDCDPGHQSTSDPARHAGGRRRDRTIARLVAASLPARRAARLNVLDAIAHE